MTSGRAIVLGDIGPWACAGMTGGRVYVRFNSFGITVESIERRLGEGAKVELKDLDSEALIDIDELLSGFAEELRATGQDEEAARILGLAEDATSNFLMVQPHKVQADPSISTE
jgi:glutamate synthase (NADPH/NADH) large chain